MSQENVAIVRRVADAYNSGNFEAVLTGIALPEFEYVTSGVWPGEDGVFHGAEEYIRFVERTFGEFDGLSLQIDEIIDAGDQAVIEMTMRARGKQSGAETTWTFFQVWTLRGGRALRGQGFSSREAALEAAGLSE